MRGCRGGGGGEDQWGFSFFLPGNVFENSCGTYTSSRAERRLGKDEKGLRCEEKPRRKKLLFVLCFVFIFLSGRSR